MDLNDVLKKMVVEHRLNTSGKTYCYTMVPGIIMACDDRKLVIHVSPDVEIGEHDTMEDILEPILDSTEWGVFTNVRLPLGLTSDETLYLVEGYDLDDEGEVCGVGRVYVYPLRDIYLEEDILRENREIVFERVPVEK
jgi:hypothetical protein